MGVDLIRKERKMSREKQIEEIAKIVLQEPHIGGLYGFADRIASRLYDADYRKASEVALEVINKALSKIQIMISAIKEQEENGNITVFNGGAKTALEIVFKDLAEVKEEYTEGEG